MAYSKQTWDTTSYVNPTRMNHIEDGIESASTADGTEYSSGVSVKDKITKFDTLLDTLLTTSVAEYDLAFDRRNYTLLTIAVAWTNGFNSNLITFPPTQLYNQTTRLYLNGNTSNDYLEISELNNLTIKAKGSNANVRIRVFGIM